MSTRFQTKINGGAVVQGASTVVTDHVATAMRIAGEGQRAWIKFRDTNDTSARFYSISFKPQGDRVEIVTYAGPTIVNPNSPSEPNYVRDVYRVLERMFPNRKEPANV